MNTETNIDELVLCRSDMGDGGWSLHAPGSTDEDIADGSAPALIRGIGELTQADYRHAASALELLRWSMSSESRKREIVRQRRGA